MKVWKNSFCKEMETVLVMEKFSLLLRVSTLNERASAASLENTVCGMQTSHWADCHGWKRMLRGKKTHDFHDKAKQSMPFSDSKMAVGGFGLFSDVTHAKM